MVLPCCSLPGCRFGRVGTGTTEVVSSTALIPGPRLCSDQLTNVVQTKLSGLFLTESDSGTKVSLPTCRNSRTLHSAPTSSATCPLAFPRAPRSNQTLSRIRHHHSGPIHSALRAFMGFAPPLRLHSLHDCLKRLWHFVMTPATPRRQHQQHRA